MHRQRDRPPGYITLPRPVWGPSVPAPEHNRFPTSSVTKQLLSFPSAPFPHRLPLPLPRCGVRPRSSAPCLYPPKPWTRPPACVAWCGHPPPPCPVVLLRALPVCRHRFQWPRRHPPCRRRRRRWPPPSRLVRGHHCRRHPRRSVPGVRPLGRSRRHAGCVLALATRSTRSSPLRGAPPRPRWASSPRWRSPATRRGVRRRGCPRRWCVPARW